MGKTISFLENDSDIIQKYIQDYKELKAFEIDSIVQELNNLEYNTSNNNGIYKKGLESGHTIIACMNGTGVILHLMDNDGNLLTSIDKHIYPTIQINNPEDLSEAEKELIKQIFDLQS